MNLDLLNALLGTGIALMIVCIARIRTAIEKIHATIDHDGQHQTAAIPFGISD